jgi:hypothetical protein
MNFPHGSLKKKTSISFLSGILHLRIALIIVILLDATLNKIQALLRDVAYISKICCLNRKLRLIKESSGESTKLFECFLAVI